MPVLAKQLSFSNISSDFDKFFDINDFIPFSFYQKYYSNSGRKRDFSLESMIYAFILKNILSIPTVDLLIRTRGRFDCLYIIPILY